MLQGMLEVGLQRVAQLEPLDGILYATWAFVVNMDASDKDHSGDSIYQSILQN